MEIGSLARTSVEAGEKEETPHNYEGDSKSSHDKKRYNVTW
jgi:hypothetical protein